MIETYSDFSETLQFYRDAGGSSCAVVGDMRMTENAAKQPRGCGARSGCWTCVRVKSDRSAEQMIESDPERYGFMRPLNRLRNFIANTQYDWTSRNYLGRTIDANGNVAVGADVYSPTMLENLLRYTLTAQRREEAAAARAGIAPRFTIMGFRELVAIDAQWSMYGIHKPFHALKVFFEVMDGHLSDPPITGPLPRTPVPGTARSMSAGPGRTIAARATRSAIACSPAASARTRTRCSTSPAGSRRSRSPAASSRLPGTPRTRSTWMRTARPTS